jgi:uncharacterized damage-inducible protein DinB
LCAISKSYTGLMQPDIAAVCQSHLEFMKWADEIAYSTLTQTPHEQLVQDRGSSFKSLFDTLTHVYRGELVWFRRVQGEPDAKLADTDSPPDLGSLGQRWPGLHQGWLAWAQSLSPEGWRQPLIFHVGQQAEEVRMPFWQIALHVVNHGSYHRGQVATMLRQAGVKPTGSDLLHFYRTR